jgi:hypothetical protein
MLVAGDATAADMNTLESKLKQQLNARGYFSLFGVTSPLREFMLWRKQDSIEYVIDLPEGREKVAVTMLEDFISYGWVSYATAEVHHTGGWTTPERLYCVRASYDTNSEDFRVSYLAHEGQHFRDTRHFPKLEQPELEYRAKLTEIALADTTLFDLLREFSDNQSDSRTQPHPYANRRLMDGLSRVLASTSPAQGTATQAAWWERIAPATIRATAARLLQEDSRNLKAALAMQ